MPPLRLGYLLKRLTTSPARLSTERDCVLHEQDKCGAGRAVLPRRMKGLLNVACFTRNPFSLAASVCKTRLLPEIVLLEAAHMFVRIP